MKVCTDSCLLGALANPHNDDKILDIGTGTGLLALMLAQKTESDITAVEIDQAAAQEAKANVLLSPWKHRIQLVNRAFQQFAEEESKATFDFIISNPPFFANNLLTGSEAKDLALHSTGLSFNDLAYGVAKLLKPNGTFVYLLPVYESGKLVEVLQKVKLYPQHVFQIYEKPGKPAIRQVVVCSDLQIDVGFSEIFIRNSEGDYTGQFKTLLKDYYLNF